MFVFTLKSVRAGASIHQAEVQDVHTGSKIGIRLDPVNSSVFQQRISGASKRAPAAPLNHRLRQPGLFFTAANERRCAAPRRSLRQHLLSRLRGLFNVSPTPVIHNSSDILGARLCFCCINRLWADNHFAFSFSILAACDSPRASGPLPTLSGWASPLTPHYTAQLPEIHLCILYPGAFAAGSRARREQKSPVGAEHHASRAL